jgi:hypothetical protein
MAALKQAIICWPIGLQLSHGIAGAPMARHNLFVHLDAIHAPARQACNSDIISDHIMNLIPLLHPDRVQMPPRSAAAPGPTVRPMLQLPVQLYPYLNFPFLSVLCHGQQRSTLPSHSSRTTMNGVPTESRRRAILHQPNLEPRSCYSEATTTLLLAGPGRPDIL